jgi:hypothetical protein
LRRRHAAALNSGQITTNTTIETSKTDPTAANGEAPKVLNPESEMQESGRMTVASKKPVASNAKLPFQSPKPPKSVAFTKASTTSNGSLNGESDPSLAHLAFSWGDATDGQANAGSPVSPSGRRLSRRKWKPSEKVLQTIAITPKKGGIVSSSPGLRIKPQQIPAEKPTTQPFRLPAIRQSPQVPESSSLCSVSEVPPQTAKLEAIDKWMEGQSYKDSWKTTVSKPGKETYGSSSDSNIY